jgi:hypothetical protein
MSYNLVHHPVVTAETGRLFAEFHGFVEIHFLDGDASAPAIAEVIVEVAFLDDRL